MPLTLGPMLCSRLLRPKGEEKAPGAFSRLSPHYYDAPVATYRRGPDWVLDIVTVQAPSEVVVDLPIHLLGAVRAAARVWTQPERPAAAAGPGHGRWRGAGDRLTYIGHRPVLDWNAVQWQGPVPLPASGVTRQRLSLLCQRKVPATGIWNLATE